jgi:hypothetical protein
MNRSEMRTLGRIGQPLSGGTYRPRRRFHVPRWLALALVLAVVGVLWVGATANGQMLESQTRQAGLAVPARPEGATTSRGAQRTDARAFATVSGLSLALPHAQPLSIAFHEAGAVEALELAPVGSLVGNDNPTAFQAPPDAAGADYRVLASLGRGRPATSAVDVTVPLGDEVLSPVTGTVRRITEYPLYGTVRDWRVEITPKDQPDLTVVVIHLLTPAVKVGDEVAAAKTGLGVARLLPLDTQADHVRDEEHPHAHIEVRPAVDAAPIDPNQRALPAEESGTS